MAMFSEGGLTSPDIWIVVTIILAASISILLNPLVIRHNIRKKRSIARDLYMALSTTDLISCIVLPTVLSKRILQPKEEQCIEDNNVAFCQADYFKYNRTATIIEKAVGGVTWYLTFSPISITSVLAISRWYQISYPLRTLNRTTVEIFLAALCLSQAIYFPFMVLNDSSEKPTVILIYIQTVFNASLYDSQMEFIFATLQASLSIMASVHTIWSIIMSPAVPGNLETRARRIRGTVRMALLNAGSAAYIGALAGMSKHDPYSEDLHSLMPMAAFVCLLPIFLSAYNPIIYTVLTNNILKINSRVEAEH